MGNALDEMRNREARETVEVVVAELRKCGMEIVPKDRLTLLERVVQDASLLAADYESRTRRRVLTRSILALGEHLKSQAGGGSR